MAYAALSTVQTIATGQPLLAATVQQANDNDEFLIDPPLCSVYNSGSQSISDSTATALTADSETFDNDSMHSTSVNTSRITIQTAGRYQLAARIEFATSTSGAKEIRFYKNGVSLGAVMSHVTTSGLFLITTYTEVVAAASDYYEAYVVQTTGGSLGVTLHSFSARFLSR